MPASVFAKYLTVQHGRAGNEAQGCIIVRSLKPSRNQAMDDVREGQMEDLGGQGFRQSSMKKSEEELTTEERSTEMK